MPQIMQQQRASFALKGVEKAKKELPNDQHKEYHSHVSALPFMIHASGLGQAAAFYRSKVDKKDYQLIYQLLSDWLSQPKQPFCKTDSSGKIKPLDLLEGITQSDMHTYLAAQAEAMVFMNWVKLFANAFMKESTTKTSEGIHS